MARVDISCDRRSSTSAVREVASSVAMCLAYARMLHLVALVSVSRALPLTGSPAID